MLPYDVTVQRPILFWGRSSLLLGTTFPRAPIVWVVSSVLFGNHFWLAAFQAQVGGTFQ